MDIRRINGHLFEKMLYNGLANLQSMEQTLNSLNVFPVADGDTGTNMRLTLENGLRYAQPNEHLGTYLQTLNDGLLLGARGNSGVILSQIFRGIAQHMVRCSAANCGDMRNAFVLGYKTAYQAVVQPVEGTILTVSREGIELIRNQIDRNTTMQALFTMYVAEMRKSLTHTPELLPVLKASGVVDSGALGYITLIEGMSKYLNGEELKLNAPIPKEQSAHAENGDAPSFSAFNEASTFEKGYCMEFILQLLLSPGYSQNFDLNDFIRELKPFGDSIAVTRDKSRVKVHIHTKEPSFIITLAQRYGEFLTFKLENMQLQHNEHAEREAVKKKRYAKPLGIVAVAGGDGMAREFAQLGCDAVLDGGATMNTPSGEFVDAYNSVDAEHIVVLPNNKNIIGAAEQAVTLCKRKNIHVLPTKSVAEGYFAVAMDVGNGKNAARRIESMQKGADGVVTLGIALAGKHYSDAAVTCDPGDYIAVVGDHVVFAAATPEDAFLGGLAHIEDIDDRETCLVFCGDASDGDLEDALAERLEDEDVRLEVSFTPGGQHTYLWICGII